MSGCEMNTTTVVNDHTAQINLDRLVQYQIFTVDRIGLVRSSTTVGRACLNQHAITVHQTLDRSRSAVLLSADDYRSTVYR